MKYGGMIWPISKTILDFHQLYFVHSGVQSVLVSLLAQKAEVVYVAEQTDQNQIHDFIKDLGFGAEILENSAGDNTVELYVRFF